VTLIRIDRDSPALSTRWVFSLLNSGSSCSPTFWTLSLSDQSGTSYQGQGQAAHDTNFAIAAGQSVELTSVFAVLPASGTQYTLTLQLSVGGCTQSGFTLVLNSYQTENFMFA
jgi:hypothetical protein